MNNDLDTIEAPSPTMPQPPAVKSASRPLGANSAASEPHREWDDFGDNTKPGFLARQRLAAVFLLACLVGVGAYFGRDVFNRKTSAHPRESIVLVAVPPPPPQPPVVIPPPPVQEQKMIEQAPVENEAKPDPKPDVPPPADLGTGVKGDGPPDGFGLSGRGNGLPGGTGSGAAAARSRWGWYAGQVQSRIQQAVRNARPTRAAALHADVKIWADGTGRVTRAAISSSTGDPALDAALRDQVLTGLQLSEPPPQGMPMPIVLRVSARRP